MKERDEGYYILRIRYASLISGGLSPVSAANALP